MTVSATANSLKPVAPRLSVSRRTRSTPFTSRVIAGGVQGFTVYNHMLLPTVFRSVEADYQHLCSNVQVWDVGCERQVEVVGRDAQRLVQLLTPRDLGRAKSGQCLYAPLIDEAARLVNDPVVLKLADDRYWLSIADSDVLLWARGLAHGLRLDVRVFEPDVWPVAIQGPKADDLVARVLGEGVRELGFFRFRPITYRGHDFIVARSGWSKQGGFEIYVDQPELGQALWDDLFARGGDLDVGHGCPNLIERIEGGLLSYGNDMTLANNPLECGLDKYCGLDGSHDYMGRQALHRIAAAGVERAIRGLIIDAPCPADAASCRLSGRGGRHLGTLTSVAWSPRFNATLAFAMVDRDSWDTGTTLTAEFASEPLPARVTMLPFMGR